MDGVNPAGAVPSIPVEDEREPTSNPDDVQGTVWQYGYSPEGALGETLKTLRKARGLSQEDVAKMMTMSGFSWRQTTVAKTEAAARPIRVNEAAALALCFGLTVNDMVGSTAETSKQTRVDSAYRVAFSMLLNTRIRVGEAKRRMDEAEREYRAGLSDIRELERIYEEARQAHDELFGGLTEEERAEVARRVAEQRGDDGERQETS